MEHDLSEFDVVASTEHITKYEQDVITPDGTGEQDNRITVYEVGGYLFKVAKIADKGWGVTKYDAESGEVLERISRGEVFEAMAQDIAKEHIGEVIDSIE